MKKTLLSSLIILLFSITGYSQSVRITAMVEGDCPTGSTAPRVIELFVEGTVDVTNLKIQFQFGSATNWVINNSIGLGEYTNSYLYVVNDVEAFDNNFPGIRTPLNTTIGTILSDVEGGEKIRLVDASNGDQVVDIFGIDGQNGENTTWNFSNSYVKRNNSFGPNPTFVESEWTITPKNTLLFEGMCWSEPALNTIIGLQSFTLSTDEFNFVTSKFKISPNPSIDYIIVEGINDKQEFEIYNVLGVKVLDGVAEKNKKININSLENGIYLIKTKMGSTSKFIKK
ncbi:T9SS type A sorting domain-containing protein [Winogradskyella wichelsiae]|uniref:T9SS type A sorting domain-containing protein n=1 Tax=Winogradskyella wichelsiae TaxID=2697007 RepID=UPI003EF357A6